MSCSRKRCGVPGPAEAVAGSVQYVLTPQYSPI